jgi:Ca-activated chloride channel family protein
VPTLDPIVPPTTATLVAGAAAEFTHPNAARPDDVLGVHVAARSLPIPAVPFGRARTFTFDGARRGWVLQLSGELLSTPAYADGRVFVGAGFTSSSVYALDAFTGEQRWEGSTPDGGPTAAIVDGNEVMFNTESCTLFAFDKHSGRLLWSKWLGDPLMSQPAAAGGRVFSAYPANGGFEFAALSTRNGNVLWHVPVGADVITTSVIDGSTVYATTMDGVVHRFDARTGRSLWVRSLGATTAPAIDHDRVYVAQRVSGGRERPLVLAARDGHVLERGDPVSAPYAAQRADVGGTVSSWSYEGSRPTFADGRLYYAMGQDLVSRDAASGRTLWHRRYDHAGSHRGMTSPSVVGSTLVVGTRSGDVYGLDIDTGAAQWAYNVGEPIAFQPTVANGWVYVTTAQGKVLGLEVADRSLDGWHMWGGNARHNGLSPADARAHVDDALPDHGLLRMRGGHGDAEFPLLRTRVHASVAGTVARVSVEQEFSNPYDRSVDADYLFPLPSDAAVDAMDLTVGTRTIHGAIQLREQARARYEAARACGEHAALLEQQRPNLFRQAVANIRRGETIRVTLRFAETVPYHDGSYEFAFPLATGSRYTPGEGGTTPARPPGDVEFSADVDLGLPIAELTSPSHAIHVDAGPNGASAVTLAHGAVLPDRDLVLRYRPRVANIAPSVLTARDTGPGVMALTVHPDLAAAAQATTPRDLVFVVDTSSSMRGLPLVHAQALLNRAIDGLRNDDRFTVLRFSDDVAQLDPAPLAPTPDNRTRAHAFVNGLVAAGTTEMVHGLDAALSRPADPARMRIVVLVTDGFIGNERDVFAAAQRSLGTSRVFAFGVGASVNRYLLEQLAEIGRGEATVVLPSENPTQAAERFYAHIDRPFLTDVQIDWGGLPVRDVYPRYVPDLFADRPLVVHGRYGDAAEGDVTIRGRVQGHAWSQRLHVRLPAQSHEHEALTVLWARARIKDLSRSLALGETDALREEIGKTGLRYGLVTPYTSFVAVDESEGHACGRVTPRALGMYAALGTGGGGYGASAIGEAFGYGGLGRASGTGSGVGYGSTAAERLVSRAVSGPLIRAAPAVVMGALSPDMLRRDVLRNMGQLRHCYEQALQRSPTLRGRIVVRFVVGPNGQVMGSTVAEDSMGDPSVGTCVANAVRTWTMPPPPDGAVVTVNYPFTFQPSEDPAPAAAGRFQVPADL